MRVLYGWLVAAMLAGCVAPVTGASGSGHALDGTVWSVAEGRAITAEVLVERLARAESVLIGEVHDNPVHHRRQAWLIERLAPAGVAFEMIPEASEEGIQVFLEQGGEPTEIGPAIGWGRLGWPDWALYRPVFAALPEGAYIAGGGVSRRDLRGAIGGGATAAFGPGASAYGLDEGLAPPVQAAAERAMIEAHCGKLPARAAAGMVEAQRLRDARFAHALRRAAAAGGGRAVLVTGNGHARTDRGVPRYLAAAEPGAEILSLGQIEVIEGRNEPADYAGNGDLPYDYVWFSERAERGDPCAAFE